MAFDDKVDHKAEEIGGKVKEGVGRATDDEQLEAEGRADQSQSKVKQAGDKVKDAGEKIKDAFKS
ncbi:CsbD family protein [Actinoplanes sp. NPDC023936]|uniref:CsbD family protein n=1 Tax=Actinoplanes sp. NPDC023936 TaxID=3154910 RepID=UPI0033F79B5F